MTMTPEELLTTTRTVRKRLDLSRPVPLELVKRALEIALQAPTGSNTQRWQWIVVTDPGQRAELGALYQRACREYLDSSHAAGKLFADDVERSKVQQRVGDSVEYLADKMGEVPVLVIPCLETPSADLPDGNQAGLWASLLPAAWSYMLACRAFTLGTALTTLHLKYEKEAAKILGLPDNVHQAALIPTAFYTGDSFKPAARQPLDEVLHLNSW
jgi:nitroreductase